MIRHASTGQEVDRREHLVRPDLTRRPSLDEVAQGTVAPATKRPTR